MADRLVMGSYGPATYGDSIADVYDDWHEHVFDTPTTVDFLAELAGAGPALELGIGTGRVALPLAHKGIEVQGIDASVAMVQKLRAKPGGEDVGVTIGDFAAVDVEGTFSLVFVVFNTLFGLLTQRDQVACFANVSGRLTSDGVFVCECFVPDLARFEGHQRIAVERVEVDEVVLETSRHDLVNQRVRSTHTAVGRAGTRIYPVEIRYAWPSELDLMAELAGLRLRSRFSGWNKEPFNSASTNHVSAYEKA